MIASNALAPARRRRARPLLAIALAALALLALTSGALGQPRGGPRQATMRAQVKAKILALRAYRVTEELALDEATAARVFPLLSKYDQQVEQLIRERAELNRKLRKPPPDAAAVDELIRRTLANRRAQVDLEAQRIGELRTVLTPAQTARLLVVLPEIERQLKAQIRRAGRQLRGGNGGDRGGNDDLVNPFERPRRARKNQPAPDPIDEDDDFLSPR
jgi:Spy/CpxP family protein refolding chaperone